MTLEVEVSQRACRAGPRSGETPPRTVTGEFDKNIHGEHTFVHKCPGTLSVRPGENKFARPALPSAIESLSVTGAVIVMQMRGYGGGMAEMTDA